MPGLLSDRALETGTISGSLSLPDGPEEQCGLGSMDAPGLHKLGLLEAVWTLRPRAAVSTFLHPEEEEKIFIRLSFPIFKLGVTFSTLQEDSQGGVWENGWKIQTQPIRVAGGPLGVGARSKGKLRLSWSQGPQCGGREQS